MLFSRGFASLPIGAADVKPGTGVPVTYTASTAGTKRDGMSLDPGRWLVTNYKRAGGPWLWNHDTTRLPIGKGEATVEANRLRMDVVYDSEDPFAVNVESKVRRGFIRGCSVSWDFCQRDGSRLEFFGRGPGVRPSPHQVRDAYYDLTEGSNVPVGMDPDALVTERSFRTLRDLGLIHSSTWRDYDDPYSDVTVEQMLPDLVEAIHAEFERRGYDLAAALDLSMRRGAIPPHLTPKADEDTDWDADEEIAHAEDAAALKRMHAWMDPDGDPDDPDTYKFPHHTADGHVVWRGVANAMSRLDQADIPEDELGGVYRHLADHYPQFGKPVPTFRAATGFHTRGAPPTDPPVTGPDTTAVSELLTAFSFRGASK